MEGLNAPEDRDIIRVPHVYAAVEEVLTSFNPVKVPVAHYIKNVLQLMSGKSTKAIKTEITQMQNFPL